MNDSTLSDGKRGVRHGPAAAPMGDRPNGNAETVSAKVLVDLLVSVRMVATVSAALCSSI